jgi:hypothetical protein
MRQLLFALVLLMGVIVAPSAAAGPPALRQGTEFGPDSETALVIFEVAPPHGVVAPWDLELYGFSPQTHRWTMTLTRGWSDFGTLGFGRFYAGLVVPAGIYAVNSVKTQNFWIACMNGGTIAFNLQAGHVNYLGVLDPSDALTQIASGLPHATRGNAVLTLYDTPRLGYTRATDLPDWEGRAQAFLAANYPGVHAPIVAPAPIETTFEPGRSFLVGRTCAPW